MPAIAAARGVVSFVRVELICASAIVSHFPDHREGTLIGVIVSGAKQSHGQIARSASSHSTLLAMSFSAILDSSLANASFATERVWLARSLV
jgi:hypothetical protein